MHPGSGFTIYGPGFRKRGQYVESDDTLRTRCHREIEQGKPGFSKSLKNRLAVRGILESGRYDTAAAKKALGIEGPFMQTKRGKIKSGVLVPREDIKRAIVKFWPLEQVQAWQQGEDVKPENITSFIEKYKREYHSAQLSQSHGKSFRRMFEEVYPTEKYPGLYDSVTSRTISSAIDMRSLAASLQSRFNNGLPITQASLRYSADSSDKRLYNQIITLITNPPTDTPIMFAEKRRSYNKVVAQLTGLDEEDISPLRGSRNYIAALTEEIVHVFFRWASLLGIPLGNHAPQRDIFRTGEERKFHCNGKECRADLRISNNAVEVKAGIGSLQEKELEDLIDKYTPGANSWLTGHSIEASTVIFHTHPRFYSHAVPRIRDAGISIIEYEWFFSKLKQIVKAIKQCHSSAIEDIRPRIGSLDYLVCLSEELVVNPTRIVKESNAERREWSFHFLKSLADKARELQDGS